MEKLSYSVRDETCFKPKEANISKSSNHPLNFLFDKDYLAEAELNETTEEELFLISDKESCLFEAVWQDDSFRLLSLAKGGSERKDDASNDQEILDAGVALRFLQLACRLDSVECARVLIEGDTGTVIRINEMDGSGRTPLQTAAAMHSTKCIDLLLKKNARTDLRSKDGDSLLALEIALSSKRMQVHWSPKESVQELLVLLRERDLSAVRLLAAATKDVADVSYRRAIEGRIVELAALLLVAADEIIPPVCISGEGSLTATKSRTMYESILEEAMALFAMEKRAQSDSNQAKYGQELVQVYRKRRKLFLCEIELIQMFGAVLPAAGNNCKMRRVLPPLLQALQIGDESVAELLILAGTDATETDADGNSALHLCLKAGSVLQNLRLMWLLLKYGAKVSQRNRLGLTPVHVAAEKGNYQALQVLLLQAPECVDLASEKEETPLFFAVRNGFLDCTKLLLQHGANCQAINLRRQRPVDLASSQDIRFILNPENQRLLSRIDTLQEDDNRDIFWSADEKINVESYGQHIPRRNHKVANIESRNMKTGICRYYESASGCFKGAKCEFAHGEDELRRVKIGSIELKSISPSRNISRHPLQPTVVDRKIFVGGLPHSVDSDCLKEFFQAEFGPVEDAIVITSRVGGQLQSKGFGFVVFKQEETVTVAVEARFVMIFGKKVEIKSAATRDLSASEASVPSFLQPQLKGESTRWLGNSQSEQKDLDRRLLCALSDQRHPPWLVKFKKWLPAFLKGAWERVGNGDGYPLSSIKADFRATCGMELDHMSLGFLKLSDFMRAFPEFCTLRVSHTGIGFASHMVLFPSNSRTQQELLPSSRQMQHTQPYPSSRAAVEPPKFSSTPGVSDDESSTTESKAGEKVNTGYAGFGEESQSFNPWRKVTDSLKWGLGNTGLTESEHRMKQEGTEGLIQPLPGDGKGASEAGQVPYFSLFQRQWDHHMLIQGFCTVCFSQPGSWAIIPCLHKVCLSCFKKSIQVTCIICSVKVQGFQLLDDANALNPTPSDSCYPPLGMGQRLSHGSQCPRSVHSGGGAVCQLRHACQGAGATVICLPCGHEIACSSCLPPSHPVVLNSCATCGGTVEHLKFLDA